MLIPLHCILAFHLLLLLHHHLAQHILRFFISLSESIFSLHLVQFECSKAESLIFMPREILLKPSKSHCTCAIFFSLPFSLHNFPLKARQKKIEAAKCKSHFALEWSFFTKKKKQQSWNETLQEVAMRIRISKSYQRPPAPLSKRLWNPPSAEIRCEDQNVKAKRSVFDFFYLSFILTDNWVTSVISVVKVGLSLHAFLFFSNFTKRVSWAFSFRCN